MGKPPGKHRTPSLHDPIYGEFVQLLVGLRKSSGLKQHHIAKALGWHQSVVSKIERQQRRMDIMELIRVAEVLRIDAAAIVRRMQRRIRGDE